MAVVSRDSSRALPEYLAGPPLVCLPGEGNAVCAFWIEYRFTKAASVEAIARTWPWGLGAGRQPVFEAQLKTEGLYPNDMPLYRPHSSYTGVPAEYGALGLVGLIVFVGALFVTMRHLLRAAGEERAFAHRATGALAMIGIEALTTDVMHFRHLFWLVAVAGVHGSNVVSRRSGEERRDRRRGGDGSPARGGGLCAALHHPSAPTGREQVV